MNIRIDWRTTIQGGALILLTTMLLLPPAIAEDSNACPDPLNGGSHSDNVYNFEYKSWSWKGENGTDRYYCSCVRNKDKKQALFIDWSDAGLSRTFIKPNDVAYAKFLSSGGAPEYRDAHLWFGPHPNMIDVQTVFKGQGAGDTAATPPEPSSDSTYASGPQPTVPKDLETTISAFLPDTARIAIAAHKPESQLTSEDINRWVEKYPGLLSRFDMQFVSIPEIDEKTGKWAGTYNACSYNIELNESDEPTLYAMRIADTKLHNMVFGSPALGRMFVWRGGRQGFRGREEFDIPRTSTLTQTTSRLDIVVPGSNVVLASMTIHYYAIRPDKVTMSETTSVGSKGLP